jgi:hypothetical protein
VGSRSNSRKYERAAGLPMTAMPADVENLKAHPLADQFDMIKDVEDGGAQFDGLKASIAKSGIQMPIKIFEGKILDGRNRYAAEKAARRKFTARDFEPFNGTYQDAKALPSLMPRTSIAVISRRPRKKR